MESAQPGHVFLRIKRFGNQWATCGIGIIPPAGSSHDPRMKKLCPKLVPGQVIELPEDHPLVKKRSKLVELVDGPERDEFIRPWVFHSAEEAVLANPSKSRLGPQQILDGLTMREGAIENAPKHRKKAREALAEEAGEPVYDDEGLAMKQLRRSKAPTPAEDHLEPLMDYDPDEPLESQAEIAKRAQNRAPRDEVHEPVTETKEPPRRRARRNRT